MRTLARAQSVIDPLAHYSSDTLSRFRYDAPTLFRHIHVLVTNSVMGSSWRLIWEKGYWDQDNSSSHRPTPSFQRRRDRFRTEKSWVHPSTSNLCFNFGLRIDIATRDVSKCVQIIKRGGQADVKDNDSRLCDWLSFYYDKGHYL